MRRSFLMTVVIGVALSSWSGPATYVSLAQDCQLCAQRAGTIAGRVIDAEGLPVSGATVYAVRRNFESGVIPSTQTDTNGHFSLIVPAALYTIYSGKMSDGYPEDLAVIYQHTVQRLDVQVTVDEVISGIELRLGLQLGKLFGQVVDFSTGQSIREANITVRLVRNPEISFTTTVDDNGRFVFLVPPEPFTSEVSSPKYETWKYSKDGLNSRSEQLEVNKGESKTLRVALHLKKLLK